MAKIKKEEAKRETKFIFIPAKNNITTKNIETKFIINNRITSVGYVEKEMK